MISKVKRALIIGDTHGYHLPYRDAVEAAKQLDLDAVFQVGDFGYWPEQRPEMLVPPELPVYWIDGNHERLDLLQAFTEPINEIAANLYYIPRGVLHTISGCKTLFVGGGYSIDKPLRTPGFDWFPEETLSPAELDRAMAHEDVDVIIAHDCPNTAPVVVDEYPASAHHRGMLQQIHSKYRSQFWFFGHYHKRWYHQCLNTGTEFRCLEEVHRKDAQGIIFDFEHCSIEGKLILDPEEVSCEA